METKEDILVLIISEIRSFLHSGKNGATLGKLSNKTGIPKTTIARYAQNAVTSAPTANVAFSFLSFFKGHSEASKLMRKPYERWWEHTGQLIGENTKTPDYSHINGFDFTSIHTRIMAKSEMPGGVSNQWIIQNFGTQIGIVAKDELLKLDILVERNGVNFPCKERWVETNRYSLLSLVKAELENFPIETAGENAILWHMTELIASETRQEMTKLFNKFLQDVRMLKEKNSEKLSPKIELFKMNLFADWAETPEVDSDLIM